MGKVTEISQPNLLQPILFFFVLHPSQIA